MLNKTGSAETKQNHFKIIDKLLLASILKPLHQVMRNVRQHKIFERTYQDGADVGLIVDKERGVFRTYACTYHREKELVCPPLWC